MATRNINTFIEHLMNEQMTAAGTAGGGDTKAGKGAGETSTRSGGGDLPPPHRPHFRDLPKVPLNPPGRGVAPPKKPRPGTIPGGRPPLGRPPLGTPDPNPGIITPGRPLDPRTPQPGDPTDLRPGDPGTLSPGDPGYNDPGEGGQFPEDPYPGRGPKMPRLIPRLPGSRPFGPADKPSYKPNLTPFLSPLNPLNIPGYFVKDK